MNIRSNANVPGHGWSHERSAVSSAVPARAQRLAFPVLLLAVLSGCATVDHEYPREPSFAVARQPDTRLSRAIEPLVAARPIGESGFYVLNDGIDALAVRLLLAAQAETSIDLQYYLIKDDLTGRTLVAALLAAAERNVRVRLLLDDVFTGGHDEGLGLLDAHPNIEVRIFNPFNRGLLGRAGSVLTDLRRVNRRMHNKSFTVDNQVTVVGGRNIADEYFGAREDARFSDLDVVFVGPVVRDVSVMFDTYWNHQTALPLPAFLRTPDDKSMALAQLRRGLAGWRGELEKSIYADALKRNALMALEAGAGALTWATCTLVYDSPGKGVPSRSKDAMLITVPLGDAFRSAQHEVLIISPYFVPRRTGVAALGEMTARGIEVTVVTNSLAANNQLAVHAGYAPSRKPLLKLGVKIFESRPDADVDGAELIASSGARATLHTKAFVIDSRDVFIGSFNFDPRSANLNTESGVIIHSPALARNMLALVAEALPEQTYRLSLDENGSLEWHETQQGVKRVLTKEPEASWWQRTLVGIIGLLPIRSQL